MHSAETVFTLFKFVYFSKRRSLIKCIWASRHVKLFYHQTFEYVDSRKIGIDRDPNTFVTIKNGAYPGSRMGNLMVDSRFNCGVDHWKKSLYSHRNRAMTMGKWHFRINQQAGPKSQILNTPRKGREIPWNSQPQRDITWYTLGSLKLRPPLWCSGPIGMARHIPKLTGLRNPLVNVYTTMGKLTM